MKSIKLKLMSDHSLKNFTIRKPYKKYCNNVAVSLINLDDLFVGKSIFIKLFAEKLSISGLDNKLIILCRSCEIIKHIEG